MKSNRKEIEAFPIPSDEELFAAIQNAICSYEGKAWEALGNGCTLYKKTLTLHYDNPDFDPDDNNSEMDLNIVLVTHRPSPQQSIKEEFNELLEEFNELLDDFKKLSKEFYALWRHKKNETIWSRTRRAWNSRVSR